ncbi:16S rRNA (adenine(1518)-N(6)/adenine(1519)-N(6))-dimethyltransferase RsmA [Patescibacteria group bacterium]
MKPVNLFSKRVVKNLLKKHDARALKRFGQNFLIDKSVVKKTIEAAELNSNDIVLEIGPGIGTLTWEIAQKAKKVLAIEKDLKMVEILKETVKGFKNIEIVNKDILRFSGNLKNYKIVANLPFYLTAPVIRKFLESEFQPKEMVLIIQKEVGQRICSKPPDMNLLAVSIQFYAKPEIMSFVSKKSFWPKPKVDSAIIKIVPKKLLIKTDVDLFFKIVKAGFSQPRKQIINNLSRLDFSSGKTNREIVKTWLLKNGIQPTQRAETLNIKDWLKLTKNYRIK